MSDWYPSGIWIIASLAEDPPVVRVFHIDGNSVEELELVVE